MRTIFFIVCLTISVSSYGATYGQKMVAAVLMGEAWSEGHIGMMAVAEVIRTRANESHLSPLSVVTSRGQFSCLNGTTLERLYGKYAKHRDYQKALKIAQLLYNQPSLFRQYTHGANHFTRLEERPEWALGRQPVAVIGAHAFYRLEQPARSSRIRSKIGGSG